MLTYKEIISKYKDFLVIILLIGIAVLSHWPWFYFPKQFGWGDGATYASTQLSLLSRLTFPAAWDFYRGNGLGGYNIVLSVYPIFSLIAFLIKVGFTPAMAEKIVILWPAVIVPTISSYFLVKQITKSTVGAIAGSFVYSYNVYLLLTQVGGQLTIGIAYAFVPLGLSLIIRSLSTNKLFPAVLASIVGLIISSYEFRIFYIYAWICFGLLIYISCESIAKRLYKEIVISILIFGTSFLIWLSMSLFWILPLLTSGSLINNEAINRGLFGDQFMNFKQSLLFFHPFWTSGKGLANFVVQPIPEYFILIPVLVISGIIVNFRRPLFKVFVVIAVIGIILTKQSAPPFPNLYLWLYTHFPGFNAFRESSKFYLLLGLGYSVLIGGFITSIKHSPIVKGFFTSFVAILFLYNTIPLMNGQIKEMLVPKQVPIPYDKLEQIIHLDPAPYRVLWVPSISEWSHYSVNHPRTSLHGLYFDNQSIVELTKEVPAPNLAHKSSINDQMLKPFLLSNAQQIISEFGIKYIVVPTDDSGEFFETYGWNRSDVINFLDSLKYLEKKNLVPQLDIYENKNYLPFVYTKNLRDEIVPLAYKIINSTQVRIRPPFPDFMQIIYFSQAYDPNWVLINNGKAISTSDVANLKNTRFAISRKPQDSPIDIYFKPQRSVQIGTVISLSFAIATTIYIVAVFIKSQISREVKRCSGDTISYD